MSEQLKIKEEVYKCSKCGLCKSVCPIYLATKNEMFLPRGRFIVINQLNSLKKKLNNDFIKNLDICLNCNLCKNFCPSSIDTYRVLTDLKNNLGYKFSIFNFSFIFRIWLNIIRISRILYNILPFKMKQQNKVLKKGKVIFFEGCVNKYINQNDKNAVLNLVEDVGYSIEKIISDCCGYPYLSEGNLNKYKKQIHKIVKKIPDNIDYVVCSCDSCYHTLKRASMYVCKDDSILSKLITFDEFLKINEFSFKNNIENVLYFKPLIRESECYLPSNIQVLNKKGQCSLMENFFVFKYKDISKKIIAENFYTKEEINNKTIVTSCLLSKIGLMKCVEELKSNANVITYAEYIFKENKKIID